MKLRYELDLNQPDNKQISGGTDLAGALPILVKASGILQGGTGFLYKDSEPQAKLRIAAENELGIFLGMTAGDQEYLSLGDADALAETVGVLGDDQQIARGLFIPVTAALYAIRHFAETGQPDPAVQWVSPEELPEDCDYII